MQEHPAYLLLLLGAGLALASSWLSFLFYLFYVFSMAVLWPLKVKTDINGYICQNRVRESVVQSVVHSALK